MVFFLIIHANILNKVLKPGFMLVFHKSFSLTGLITLLGDSFSILRVYTLISEAQNRPLPIQFVFKQILREKSPCLDSSPKTSYKILKLKFNPAFLKYFSLAGPFPLRGASC